MRRKCHRHLAYSLLRLLGGNHKPPERNHESETRSDSKCACRPNFVYQRAADETTQEEEDDGQSLMIPRDDETTPVEQLRFRHEFTPGGSKDNCKNKKGSVNHTRGVKVNGVRTGRGELGIETFAHDTLETHAGADEPDGHK